MYGDRYFGDFIAAVTPDDTRLKALLDRYQVAWTVFPPKEPVVAALDRQPGWRRFYADAFAVVHVRDQAIPDKQTATPRLRPRVGQVRPGAA